MSEELGYILGAENVETRTSLLIMDLLIRFSRKYAVRRIVHRANDKKKTIDIDRCQSIDRKEKGKKFLLENETSSTYPEPNREHLISPSILAVLKIHTIQLPLIKSSSIPKH